MRSNERRKSRSRVANCNLCNEKRAYFRGIDCRYSRSNSWARSQCNNEGILLIFIILFCHVFMAFNFLKSRFCLFHVLLFCYFISFFHCRCTLLSQNTLPSEILPIYQASYEFVASWRITPSWAGVSRN